MKLSGIVAVMVVCVSLSSIAEPFDLTNNRYDFQTELDSLAINLYHEERSVHVTDEDIAQIGYVVLNRVRSKHYPNTITGVVYQTSQFSWVLDKHLIQVLNYKATKRAYKIASEVINGTIPNRVGKSDHYLNKNKTNATWWEGMRFKGYIGNHWFYQS